MNILHICSPPLQDIASLPWEIEQMQYVTTDIVAENSQPTFRRLLKPF